MQPTASVPQDDEPASGQLFDAAMRRWAESNLSAVAVWLDPSLAALEPDSFVQRTASFTVPSVHADLLMTAGPGRLMHVEYETRPKRDLVARMYNYRGRIMTLHPTMMLTQHVIVLGAGRVVGHDDLANGFTLDLKVLYLREQDPSAFLKDPVMAPLAVLARGRPAVRERSLGMALELIRDSGHRRRGDLLQIAETLATIRLDLPTIERIRKENGMSIQPFVEFYRDTEVGQHLRAIGEQQGREEGREEGREGVLQALLRVRFGPQPDLAEVASRLAAWPDADAAVKAINDASDFRSLRAGRSSS